MRTKILLLAAAILIVGAGATALQFKSRSEQTARASALLLRALTEGQSVPCEGVKTVRLRDPVGGARPDERARVLMAGDGRSRIEYLSGDTAGLIVWDDGNNVWRANPREERIATTPAERFDPAVDQRRRELILRNFLPSLVGLETIAGRRAEIVELRPRHGGQPWKQLSIDADTGVVLASREFDAAGRELQSTRFEEFTRLPETPPAGDGRFSPAPDRQRAARRLPAPGEAGPLSVDALGREVGFALRPPAYLPAGFEWEGGYADPCGCPGCRRRTARMEFTNGLSTLLLFACAHACPGEPSCLTRGKDGQLARRTVGNMTCVAVGDLPRVELERIVGSVPGEAPGS